MCLSTRRKRGLALACAALSLALGAQTANADVTELQEGPLLRVPLQKVGADGRIPWRSLGAEQQHGKEFTAELVQAAEAGNDVISLLNFMDAQVPMQQCRCHFLVSTTRTRGGSTYLICRTDLVTRRGPTHKFEPHRRSSHAVGAAAVLLMVDSLTARLTLHDSRSA